MEQLGVLPYFTSAMVKRLRQSMADHPMMPSIVQQEANTLLGEREAALTRLKALEDALSAFNFEEDNLEDGEAEVGFQIPRDIFENELEGFARELHELRLIIRAFSEAAGNAGEKIELRDMSTSDPLIYVALGFVTVKYIGEGIAWCLERWKTLEEIRNLRASTAKLKEVPAREAMVAQWDEMIEQTISASVREEAERLAGGAAVPEARQNELANHLAKALEGLLARIERGMTVDIRFLPAPPAEGESAEEASAKYEDLRAIRRRLVFPQVGSQAPLLRLTKQPEVPPRRRRPNRGAAPETPTE